MDNMIFNILIFSVIGIVFYKLLVSKEENNNSNDEDGEYSTAEENADYIHDKELFLRREKYESKADSDDGSDDDFDSYSNDDDILD